MPWVDIARGAHRNLQMYIRVYMQVMGGGQRSLLGETKIDCTSACQTRCGRNWKNSMCNKLCNMCCGKCNCVAPGTGQDTRSQCPCYANMVNSKNGKPKCP
uniref:Uncharacterized protein n=1 Tax=Avena sativa TaxID=4498 RepID=A0ACD5U863_AVESA